MHIRMKPLHGLTNMWRRRVAQPNILKGFGTELEAFDEETC
jgi:hypothetical protein